MKGNRRIRNVNPIGRPLSLASFRDFGLAEMPAGAGIKKDSIPAIWCKACMKICTGSIAGINLCPCSEKVKGRLVDFLALALVEDGKIPGDSEKFKILDGLSDQMPGTARLVKIFNTQGKPSALSADGEVGQHGTKQISRVQIPTGRGGEAANHLRHPQWADADDPYAVQEGRSARFQSDRRGWAP